MLKGSGRWPRGAFRFGISRCAERKRLEADLRVARVSVDAKDDSTSRASFERPRSAEWSVRAFRYRARDVGIDALELIDGSRPVRKRLSTSMSGSAPIQREIIPGSRRVVHHHHAKLAFSGRDGAGNLINATLITSQKRLKRHNYTKNNADGHSAAGSRTQESISRLPELRGDDVLVNGFMMYSWRRMQRARNMCDVVFSVQNTTWRIAAGHAAQIAENS